ncbi:uncharacterized protein LOC111639848 [Centruroides sculpturatus]|uniref:uncharacterized protein LOC111639848 n=1 Tax=Centruroides sculpturatus TaxID=218467 RepID=UPI000C6D3E46|nr:uncharacterized protein LOC111639848 [Centruroides sculpturatus]
MDQSSHKHISFLQVNLGRGIDATSLLAAKINNYDFIFIQEPYCQRNIPACLPTSSTIVKGTEDYPWAITVVNNKNFPILLHKQHSSEHIVCIETIINNNSLIIINVYCPYNNNIHSFLDHLQDTINNLQNNNLLLVGDFNSHSPAWGGDRQDNRGDALENFLATNNLILVNDPFSPPTFFSSRGQSWIDITTASLDRSNLITNWKVLQDVSLSEHAYLHFEMTTSTNIRDIDPSLRYNLSCADWEGFTHFLQTKLTIYNPLDLEDAHNFINNSINNITTACNLFIPRTSLHRKTVPWWNTDLTGMRNHVRHLRKSFQRCRRFSHIECAFKKFTEVKLIK